MPISGNAINNNSLAMMAQRAGPAVTAAIKQASIKTGVDFAYMMEKAAAESSFKANAKAKTSSAAGLYQFIESTWLQMVDRYGDKYGLEDYADKISARGKVSDPSTRREILALRNDPEIAALMAGEFAAENRQTLIDSGISAKDIGSTELYLAHFLGAGAASEFIKGMNENPLMAAADIFPSAARANKNVFYDTKTHRAKSLAEVHAFFDKKFGGETTLPNENLIAQSKVETVNLASLNTSPSHYSHKTSTPIMNPVDCMVDYNVSTQDIIALMGTPARQGMDQIASDNIDPSFYGDTTPQLPRAMINDPVAIMLLARTEPATGEEDDNKKTGKLRD